jgi:hypothetical protein
MHGSSAAFRFVLKVACCIAACRVLHLICSTGHCGMTSPRSCTQEYTLLFLKARGTNFEPHLEALTVAAIRHGAPKALPWLWQWQDLVRACVHWYACQTIHPSCSSPHTSAVYRQA